MFALVVGSAMTVVIGVDRAENSTRTLVEGSRLATQFETGVDVVHVLDRSEFMDLQRTTVSDTGEPVDMEEVRAVATDIARETAEGALDEFEAVGLVGDAAAELLRWSEERDAHYVVIGVRHRSAVGKVLFGSVAGDVLIDSERPVVAVPRERRDGSRRPADERGEGSRRSGE